MTKLAPVRVLGSVHVLAPVFSTPRVTHRAPPPEATDCVRVSHAERLATWQAEVAAAAGTVVDDTGNVVEDTGTVVPSEGALGMVVVPVRGVAEGWVGAMKTEVAAVTPAKTTRAMTADQVPALPRTRIRAPSGGLILTHAGRGRAVVTTLTVLVGA